MIQVKISMLRSHSLRYDMNVYILQVTIIGADCDCCRRLKVKVSSDVNTYRCVLSNCKRLNGFGKCYRYIKW